MRDFLPGDVRKREYVIGVIKQVYESYGFEPLETPAVENIDTLMGKYGDEGNQLIFKILKRGDKLRESRESRESSESKDSLDSPDTLDSLTDLALRYDLTVPLSRVVANNKNDLPKFFKRYQIQPVWRADRPARGRFREFYQCDVDCIGSESMIVEAEIILAASKILDRLGFEDYEIRFNHRTFLTGMLTACGIADKYHNDALVAIDKLDKIGPDGVHRELVQRGIDESVGNNLISLFEGISQKYDDHRAVINNVRKDISNTSDEKAKTFRQSYLTFNFSVIAEIGRAVDLAKNDLIEKKGFDEIDKLFRVLASLDCWRFMIDPSLARGLSYYTGTIMEIVLTDGDFQGSIGGGGRYDGLIGMFGKEQIPACGFSLGLERILVVMEERGMFPPEIADSTPADVMVTIWSDETVADSLKLASELRSQNLRVTVYPEADKLGKQLKYADQIRVPYVCVLGESEIADGTVTLKNMKTGEQQAYPRDEIASKIV